MWLRPAAAKQIWLDRSSSQSTAILIANEPDASMRGRGFRNAREYAVPHCWVYVCVPACDTRVRLLRANNNIDRFYIYVDACIAAMLDASSDIHHYEDALDIYI